MKKNNTHKAIINLIVTSGMFVSALVWPDWVLPIIFAGVVLNFIILFK